MKITKTKRLIEDVDAVETEEKVLRAEIPEEDLEDIAIDDVKKASVDEIADSVQVAGAVASEGEETFTDANAKKIAQELKTAAKGLDHTAWAPLDVRNELTEMLDFCLASSMSAKKSGRRDGTDVLVTGLPGSGKTGITTAWAEDRGVNLFYLNAKNRELDAVLNGFPVDVTDANGKHQVIKSRSTILDPLEEPNSVLFLDEFNRAPEDLRAILLTLINEHEIEGSGENSKRGKYEFKNLLFTIACINPNVPSDPGAMELFDAEKSRFVAQMDYDSNKTDAINYIPFYLQKVINKLDKNDPDYAFLYVQHQKMYNLALRILKHRRFQFDTRKDLPDLAEKRAVMLNQRELTNAITSFGSSKDMFLRWVDNYSRLLPKNIEMFHEILDTWNEPIVTPPNGTNVPVTTVPDNDVATGDTAKVADPFGGDFDSIFGSGGTETDTGLFGTGVGGGSTVDATQARKRLNDFDFTL